MNFNGRLLLLVVVIGLFVRVWKTNEHPRTRPVERSRSQAAERVVAPAVAAAETALPATTVSDRRDRDERPTIEENWTAATSPIPLPAGITAGTYRAISDSGRVAKLTVAVESVSAEDAASPVAATEMLMTVVGAERWYLIRLRMETPAVESAVVTPEPENLDPQANHDVPHSENLPPANRKFDFSGYESVPNIPVDAAHPDATEREVIEQASRPNPPEMPSPL